MSPKPLISVIIPAFNEEGNIARAIESMTQQTYENLEILVIDDHSTDKTPDVVKEIAASDSRVQYERLPLRASKRKNWRGYDINAGWLARAYGFQKARGGWITTQDADDASLLNRIEFQYEMAQKYNATMVTVEWQQATPETIGKVLDIHTLFRDKGEDTFLIPKEVINTLPKENRGILMNPLFHHLIPFPVKWFPYTRPLFYGAQTRFPGADNCMLFRREVIHAGVNFRSRNHRTWGTPSGRGSGRDFVMHATEVFKNSYSFTVPLYLWDVKSAHPYILPYTEYLNTKI